MKEYSSSLCICSELSTTRHDCTRLLPQRRAKGRFQIRGVGRGALPAGAAGIVDPCERGVSFDVEAFVQRAGGARSSNRGRSSAAGRFSSLGFRVAAGRLGAEQ